MKDALHQMMSNAHASLEERLVRAKDAMESYASRREIVQSTDAFLVNTCRHTAAVCDLVLPAAKSHLPDGSAVVHAYVAQCKRAETAIIRAKQRMYGEAHAVVLPWATVWNAVVDEVHALRVIEQELVSSLEDSAGFHGGDGVANEFAAVSIQSPTRPHPNSPHTGFLAHSSRRMWAWADRFWDNAEGRIVHDRPEVVEPEVTPSIAA